MNYKYKIIISKLMSKILRHEPSIINANLNEEGWLSINFLIDGLHKLGYVSIKSIDIEEIVRDDSKERYSIKDGLIRANAGHNNKINVDISFKEEIPSIPLYHGTVGLFIDSILEKGLLPVSRQYVHLSSNIEMAKEVSKRRRGLPIILEINVNSMINDGYKFYLSDNNIWLIDKVPSKYLTILDI